METTTCCSRSKNIVCTAKPALRFQYGKNKRGQWYWHIRAQNGEIIAQGEGYKRERSVHRVLLLLGQGLTQMTPEFVAEIPRKKKK